MHPFYNNYRDSGILPFKCLRRKKLRFGFQGLERLSTLCCTGNQNCTARGRKVRAHSTSFHCWPIIPDTTTFRRLLGLLNRNNIRIHTGTKDLHAIAKGKLKGRDPEGQSSHKLKVIIIRRISRVRILFLIANNFVFFFDQLLRRLGLKFLHRLC